MVLVGTLELDCLAYSSWCHAEGKRDTQINQSCLPDKSIVIKMLNTHIKVRVSE